MKRYNVTIKDIESDNVTDLKKASMKRILSTLKSLSQNTLEEPKIKIKRKRTKRNSKQ